MSEVRPVPVEVGDSIPACFAKRVAATPDAVAYRDYDAVSAVWKDFTWKSVAEVVAQVRTALAREGLAAGERVAIMSRNCREWICFDQGALASGLVVVPLFVDDRPDNVAYILNDSGVRVLLVEGAEHLEQARARSPIASPACSAS